MEIATGVFRSRSDAERVVSELRDLGVPQEQIGLITPDSQSSQGNTRVAVTDTEEPGMGRAMGATVGGAMGAASGATLGLAAASLVVPGVGPLLAFGLVGGAVLGLVGAAAGSAIGDQV
ncbi:MAG TPA: hypothetical protein VFO36_03675, partial [Nitrospiraceae bacterium]|nr:hypothetical protein [Nitrospiraceae bacterium]